MNSVVYCFMLVVTILFGYFLYLKLLIYFDIHFTIFVSRLGYTFCYKLYSFKNVYQFLQYGTYMVYNFIQILLRNFRPCVYSMPSLVISLERPFAVCLSVFKHHRKANQYFFLQQVLIQGLERI